MLVLFLKKTSEPLKICRERTFGFIFSVSYNPITGTQCEKNWLEIILWESVLVYDVCH